MSDLHLKRCRNHTSRAHRPIVSVGSCSGRVGRWRGRGFARCRRFPSSPPKIPYGGFSPVRLQRWVISRRLPASGAHVSRLPSLPPACVLTAFSFLFSALCRRSCALKHRHSSGYAALPQGPSLRSGFCCPGPSSLIRPHPTYSQAQRDFTALQLIRPAFAVCFRLGDPRLAPCFHRSFFLNMSSSATPGSPAAVYTQFLHRQRWPSSL